MLACQLDDDSVWVNRCGVLDCGSASFWWGRLAGGLVRMVHGILGQVWTLELLLHADDFELTGANQTEREGMVLAVLLLLIVGTPMKWMKF